MEKICRIFIKPEWYVLNTFEDEAYNDKNDRWTSRLLPSATPTLIDCPNPPKTTMTKRRTIQRKVEEPPNKFLRIDNQTSLIDPSQSTSSPESPACISQPQQPSTSSSTHTNFSLHQQRNIIAVHVHVNVSRN